jgi:hypothetical protein
MAEELIASWTQRADVDRDLLAAPHDILPPQLRAVELLRGGIEISHDEGNFFAGRNVDPLGSKR